MLVLTAFQLCKVAALRLLPALCDCIGEFVVSLPGGVRGSACAVLFEVVTNDCDPTRKTFLAEWFLAVRAAGAASDAGVAAGARGARQML